MFNIYHVARCGVVRKIQKCSSYKDAEIAFRVACLHSQKYAKHDDIVSIKLINCLGDSVKEWHTSDPTYWRNSAAKC